MSDTIIIIVVLALIAIVAMIAFNMYQEGKYRQQMRQQFGHSDKDALLNSNPESVRDGKSSQAGEAAKGESVKPLRQKDVSQAKPMPSKAPRMADSASINTGKAEPQLQPKTPKELFAAKLAAAAASKPDVEIAMEDDENIVAEYAEPVLKPEKTIPAPNAFKLKEMLAPQLSQTKLQGKGKLLMDLKDVAQLELPWFDPRFDYMSYISLREAQELHAIPRLSSRHRFQIVGCTMDDRFQIAEPIPSVYYQGFIIGLQGVSRSGLATTQELEQFGEQVNGLAEKMNGGLLLTDIKTFLDVARPLDELCERVDSTIAIHLVSRANISGTELRTAVEMLGFELGHDGSFHLPNEKGQPLFSIVTLDNTSFTSSLLSSQTYRGFSMLYDIPHVPAGEKNFNRFMDLAVKLSSALGLDLVNDKLEELSTQWLKEVRTYVLARQAEMQKVGIEPGEEHAQRLFS